MTVPSEDLYAVLGVAPDAPDEVIHAAHAALAAKYHPDKNGGDAQAEAKAGKINAAFEILGDATKRRDYDQSRHASNETTNNASAPLSTHIETSDARPRCPSCRGFVGVDWNRCGHCGHWLVDAATAWQRAPEAQWFERADGLWEHPLRGVWRRDGERWELLATADFARNHRVVVPAGGRSGCSTGLAITVVVGIVIGGIALVLGDPVVALALFFVGIPILAFGVWAIVRILARE